MECTNNVSSASPQAEPQVCLGDRAVGVVGARNSAMRPDEPSADTALGYDSDACLMCAGAAAALYAVVWVSVDRFCLNCK